MSASWGKDTPLATLYLTSTVQWLVSASALLFVSCKVGQYLAEVVDRSLVRFGRFHAIAITRGDHNKQTRLIAGSSRSFWKFVASGATAILWNIIGTILAAIMIKNG
jgi:hypothetical protein